MLELVLFPDRYFTLTRDSPMAIWFLYFFLSLLPHARTLLLLWYFSQQKPFRTRLELIASRGQTSGKNLFLI